MDTNCNDNKLATRETTAVSHIDDTPTIDRIIKRRDVIQQAMTRAMKPNVDYGRIPGCGDKPTLLQPGAEKIANLFKLAPDPEMDIIELANGHREYRFKCRLLATDGTFLGAGVGSCTTMETKYRYRKAERECPLCHQPAIIKGKKEYGGGWLCFKKKGGCGANFDDEDGRITEQETGQVENVNIADVYNTCEKMAYKRAFVSAVLKVTAASDVFTQDIEDMNMRRPAPQESPEPQWEPGDASAPASTTAPPQTSRTNAAHPTDKQVKMIWARAKKLGKSEEELKDFLTRWFEERHEADEEFDGSPASISYEEGQEVIKWLDAQEAKAAMAK